MYVVGLAVCKLYFNDTPNVFKFRIVQLDESMRELVKSDIFGSDSNLLNSSVVRLIKQIFITKILRHFHSSFDTTRVSI